MTLLAVRIQAVFGYHFLNAGIVAFYAGGIDVRIHRIGHRALAVGLAMADKTFNQHYAMLTLVPVLGDFRSCFDMTFKAIRDGVGTFQVFDRVTS